MELKKLLEKVTAGFVRTQANGMGNVPSSDAHDVAVAEVALMIAALDGSVRPEEFAAYRWIVGRCRGLSDGDRRTCLDAAVRKSGQMLLMAQVGAYTEEDILAAFENAVGETLPSGFSACSQTDVRRAFVLWLSAAVADGEFSAIERHAVERLERRLLVPGAIEKGFFEAAERHLGDLSDPERRTEAERALDNLVIFAPKSA